MTTAFTDKRLIMPESALELQALEKRYGDFVALEPLSLSVEPGTFLSVLGPSGSGKTTVLRLIGGFTPPSSGRIRLGGQDITDMPIFRRPSNTVFQDYALFPHLNVMANVGYGLSVRGKPSALIKTKVDEILAVMGLETMASRMPAQLSGGQRQRVALARALICEPKIMLLDEPLAALDAELRHQMQDFLKAQQRRTGITFLFVTHDQQEAIGISDLILVMKKGLVEQIASPRDLYYTPQTPFVAGFFGDNNLINCTVMALDGAYAEVETAMGRFMARNPNACALGDQATMALRPEAISVSAQNLASSTMVTAEGQLLDGSFGGSATRLAISIQNTEPLFVTVPSDRLANMPAPGACVMLSWAKDSAVLIKGHRIL